MKKLLAFAALAAISILPNMGNADEITLGSSNDTWIRDGRSHAANGTDGVLDARLEFVPYIQFDMSGIGIDSISDATLRLWKVASARNDTITNGRFATYGLADLPGNTLQTWHELLDFDPGDATNGLDFRNVGNDYKLNADGGVNGVDRSVLVSLDPDDGTTGLTEFVDNGTGEITLSGSTLVAFLNSRVDANGLVTFLLPVEASTQGWGIASKENANVSLRPTLDLTFTAVPEPGSLAVLGLGALVLTSVRRRRS